MHRKVALAGLAGGVRATSLRLELSHYMDAGKVTTHSLDPAGHVGPRSYISPTARLADGRRYLDRTTGTVIEIIRHDGPTRCSKRDEATDSG